jgi:hypothetical protein
VLKENNLNQKDARLENHIEVVVGLIELKDSKVSLVSNHSYINNLFACILENEEIQSKHWAKLYELASVTLSTGLQVTPHLVNL